MGVRVPNGALTRRLGRELRDIIEKSGVENLHVYYDHGEAKESLYAVPYFEPYSNGTTLANVDISVVKDGKIVVLCEVEERGASPTHLIGDIDNIFVAEKIQIGGVDYPFDGATFILGVLVERGKGREKAKALCTRVPSIINDVGRKGIAVIPIVEQEQDGLVDHLRREICHLIGIGSPPGKPHEIAFTGNYIVDLLSAAESISVPKGDDESRLRLTTGHLETAKGDIQASTVLYEKGLYAQSTYFLQQATEKITKAYLLWTGIMSQDEVRRMSHDPLLGFIMLVQKMKPVVEVYGHYNEGATTDLTDLVALDEERGLAMAKMSAGDISALISFLDLFASLLSLMAGALSSIDAESVRPQAMAAAKEMGIPEDSVDSFLGDPDQLDDTKSEALSSLLEIVPLFILSAATFPHEEYTRYCDGLMKPSDYTSDLGIVSGTPGLLQHLSNAADGLEFLLSRRGL